MKNILDRIQLIADNEGLTITAFERQIGASKGVLSGAMLKGTGITSRWILKVVEKFPLYSADWLLTGEGEMLRSEDGSSAEPARGRGGVKEVSGKNIIPFYNEVSSIGGSSTISDVSTPHGAPTSWINAGDWFPGATSAIIHYGDSMEEYPSGTIIVLKRVKDMSLIVPGCNYSIETSEYRVTKRLQDGGADHFIAYSSNKETYPDGKQVHEPFVIPKKMIRHIDLVLGIVGKEF